MHPSSVLNSIIQQNEAGDYTQVFALLACVESELRQREGSDADLLAKRAYLQATMGDPLAAFDSCTRSLELQWTADTLCLRARCSLNIALCLSGVLAFPVGHRPVSRQVTARLALHGALRDCIAAGSMCTLDEEMLAMFNVIVWVLDRTSNERTLRRELRNSCLGQGS